MCRIFAQRKRKNRPMETANDKYRYELKYECDEIQMALIRNRISAVMKYDSHVSDNNDYTIRSLYFDTYDDRCYYENENGDDPREKFRIRVYNADFESINLELKKKIRGMTQKESCNITYEQCQKMVRGEEIPITNENPALLNKFLLRRKLAGLRPVIIVEYDRIPYIYRVGNVRITFDCNIRSSNRIASFMEAEIPSRLVRGSQQLIMEVKYDELLPEFIRNSAQILNLRQTAFSKFYMCRKYNLGGTINDIF